MRRLLVVSPHFPPTNAPDNQRVRMSLPYYQAHGWTPVVLAVDARRVGAPQDPLLAETLPVNVSVHRVAAWPERWTRLGGLGNVAYRAWFQLAAAGARLLAAERIDLVFFSTTQFVATALGRRWRARFSVPYVVDLQDPWRTDYYDRPGAPPPPGGWKYRFARWQAARLEESAWRDAAGFMSVSAHYLRQLRARYAWFAAKPAAVIPFGANPDDFAFARSRTGILPAFEREPGAVHLLSVGAIGPIMREAIQTLFAGLAALRRREPGLVNRLRFHFIGTSYAPAGCAFPSVAPLASGSGVADLVRESPGRIGYFAAIKTMLAADGLLVVGSNDPGYNPSKLANCALAARPTLAIGPAPSVFADMADELGFANFMRVPAEPDAIAISRFLAAVTTTGSGQEVPSLPRLPLSHTAASRTAQQCALFDEAVGIKT